MEFSYKKNFKSPDERREYCNLILRTNPNKIPMVIEREPRSMLEDIDKTRFLISNDFTLKVILDMIRFRGAIKKEIPLFLLANGTEYISEDITLSELYDKYKDYQDGFLYMTYSDNIDFI